MSRTATKRTAHHHSVYGMREVGGFGVRGFVAHCPECGFLSRVYDNCRGAEACAGAHRCPKEA